MDIELTFVFPTYDEDENIFTRLKEIEALRLLIDKNIEVIISDDTPSNFLLEQQISDYAINSELSINYILRSKEKKKRGLAFSILDGLNLASGRFICVADVDGQHNIFDSFQLYEISKRNNQMVIGSRFKKGGGMGSGSHYIFSFAFNIWLILLTRVSCLDKTGGFFVMPKDLYESKIKNKSKFIFKGYGDYFINLIRFMHKKKINYIEKPVFYRLRSSGYSKSNFNRMIITYSLTALKSVWSKELNN